jgi:hypothetical protein
MSGLTNFDPTYNLKNEEHFFDQYKLIIESVHQLSMARETSNSFWATVNGVTITGVSFVNILAETTKFSKLFLVSFLLATGYLFCLSWISYLNTMRKNLYIRYEILLEMEKNLPVKFFGRVYEEINKKEGISSLSAKEILVPAIFIMAYTFCLISLIISNI